MSALQRFPLVAALAVVVVVLPVTPATAGTFAVFACDSTGDHANNSWSEEATADPVQVSSHSVCPSGDPDPFDVPSLRTGIGVFDNLGAPGDMPPDGTYIEQRFDAPAGTRITRAVITRDIGNADYWTPYGRVDGVDQANETCQVPYGEILCRITGTRDFTGLDATRIAYGVRCHYAPYCSNGGTLHDIWVLVLRATVYLDDTQAPSVATPSATGLADGQWHRAPGPITYDASDNTGVRTRRVLVGAAPVGTASAPGAASGGCGGTTGVAYSYTRPCAGARGLNGARSVTVDPCSLGTGTHALRAAATDTGGAESQSAGTVSVKADCTGPSAAVDAGADERTEGSELEPAFSATDAHSGVATVERQYRTGLNAWQPYVAALTVAPGVTYRFRARATDAVGNVGPWAESADVEGRLDTTSLPDVPAQPTDLIRTDNPAGAVPDHTITLPVTTEGAPGDAVTRRIAPRLVLTVTRARVSRRVLRVRGRASASARLALVVRLRTGRRRATVRRVVTTSAGAWSAKLRLPARLRGARVVSVSASAGDGVRARLAARRR